MVASQISFNKLYVSQPLKIFVYAIAHSIGQDSNTLTIGVNTIAIKKNKKVEIDISEIEYYNYHKKSYYTSKCFEKKLKN